MKYPKGGDGHYDRFAKQVYGFYKRAWVSLFFAPIALAIPPTFITAYYANQTFKKAINDYVPDIGAVLDNYIVVAILLAAAYPACILAFAKSITRRMDSRGLSVDSLLHLLSSLDRIVGLKEHRFGLFAKNLSAAPRKKNNTFCEITQPLFQIAENVRGICDLFNALNTKKTSLIRVILAEIKDGKISSIPVHYPADEPVRSSIKALNHPNSSILTAYRTRKIVVIEDTRTEGARRDGKDKKYVDTGSSKEGSLICYPVVYVPTEEVPFIISVHCDQKGYFRKDYAETYELNLQRFALRLSLEYSLLLMKEKICAPTKQKN